MTFAQFLLALQGPLLNAAIGIGLFFLADWWPAFSALSSRQKRLVILLMCMVIPFAAAGVAVLMGYQAGTVEATWWPAAVAGAAAFTTSTGAHGVRDLGAESRANVSRSGQ